MSDLCVGKHVVPFAEYVLFPFLVLQGLYHYWKEPMDRPRLCFFFAVFVSIFFPSVHRLQRGDLMHTTRNLPSAIPIYSRGFTKLNGTRSCCHV